MLDELVANLIVLDVFLIVLGIGGLIADFILPHIPFVERFLDTLPNWDDEDEKSEEVTKCSSSTTRPRESRCDTSTRTDCKRRSERRGRSRKQREKRRWQKG